MKIVRKGKYILVVHKWTRMKLNYIVFFIQHEHEFYNSEIAYSLTALVSNRQKHKTYPNNECPKILMNYQREIFLLYSFFYFIRFIQVFVRNFIRLVRLTMNSVKVLSQDDKISFQCHDYCVRNLPRYNRHIKKIVFFFDSSLKQMSNLPLK